MNKRLQKRHKRQVSRARDQVKLSEPDVRTPEQIRAAREGSRPAGGWGNSPHAKYSTPSIPNRAGTTAHSPAKVDG